MTRTRWTATGAGQPTNSLEVQALSPGVSRPPEPDSTSITLDAVAAYSGYQVPASALTPPGHPSPHTAPRSPQLPISVGPWLTEWHIFQFPNENPWDRPPQTCQLGSCQIVRTMPYSK